MNAIAEYEMMFNLSATDIKGDGISNARNIAYIGFKEADDKFDLSLKEVGQLITPKNMVEIFEAFGHCMSTITGSSEKK